MHASSSFSKSTPTPLRTVLRQNPKDLSFEAELHWRHIVEGGDPFEDEVARPLDYGHWSAHRLERLADGDLKHGEAVAIGLGIDAALAVELGHATSEFQHRVLGVLHKLGFTLDHPQLDDPAAAFCWH